VVRSFGLSYRKWRSLRRAFPRLRKMLEIKRANPTPKAWADHEPEERERERVCELTELVRLTCAGYGNDKPSNAGADRQNPHPHTCYTPAGAPPPSCCSLCSHYDHTRSAAWAHHASQLRHHYKDSRGPCFFACQQRPFTTTPLITTRHTMQ